MKALRLFVLLVAFGLVRVELATALTDISVCGDAVVGGKGQLVQDIDCTGESRAVTISRKAKPTLSIQSVRTCACPM